ncbi:MAG: hypothetical protein JWO20_1388 [Candidatus Angelobacter sp.]|nr:hypothetical protein [Candidatus Angelobacter sp.]
MNVSTLDSPLQAGTQSPAINRNRTMVAIALVSFASLLLELALTRLFSVVLFYHFAFLAISVALLGLGAGGVFAHIERDWLSKWNSRQLGVRICIANAILTLLVLEDILHLPISMDLTLANFGRLTVLYLAAAIPFFFTGLLFSIVFAREAKGIGSIYASDLLGGALACMAVVPLLNTIGGPNAIVCSSLMMAIAAAVWAEEKRSRMIALCLSAAFVVLIAANHSGKLIDIVYAKGVRRDQPWMLFAKWNAISRVEVDKIGESKYIVIDADASTAIMNADPKNWDVNGEPRPKDNGNPPTLGYNWKKDLMSAAPAVANVLRPNGKFAIIGPGGGVDVLRAVANGSKDVTGIEINPIIADTIMRGNHADYSYHLYERPEVHMNVADGRSWIRNSKDQYDVIQMTLVDTWASTAAGAFALSENNLYTVEAFAEYFQHLKPDGFIAITRWEFKEPREALRVVSQEMEAISATDPKNLDQHFIVVSDGDLNVDGRPVLVLAKKNRFTEEEIRAVRYHVTVNDNLKLIYVPEQIEESKRPNHSNAFYELITQRGDTFKQIFDKPGLEWSPRSIFLRDYPYNITPVYDKNPFFFFTLKTKDVMRNVLAGTGRGMDWRINLGVTVLFMVLAISVVAVLAFLVLPLAMRSRSKHRPGPSSRLFYFIAVGLGFILVEIALIQRFVLFLGHPTYALTVVVFLMLLSSGVGSFVSRSWLKRTSSVRVPLLAIAAAIVAYVFLLPVALSSLIGAAFGLKVAISAALIVPLGFAMGMPFPTGLRALSELDDNRVEWAWAMNAAASVLGSVSAMIIAIHFGLNVTLVCGAIAYLLAMLLVGSFRQQFASST